MANVPYKITLGTGQIVEGITDSMGATELLQKDAMNIANVQMMQPKEAS